MRRPALRPLLLGVYAQAGAFGATLGVTAVYATVLAIRARGTPNQGLINAFAAWSAPWVMAITGAVLTFLFGRQVVREMQRNKITAATVLGVTSAVIGMVPAFILHGRPSLRAVIIAATVVLAAWAGGALSTRRATTPPS